MNLFHNFSNLGSIDWSLPFNFLLDFIVSIQYNQLNIIYNIEFIPTTKLAVLITFATSFPSLSSFASLSFQLPLIESLPI